MSKMSLEDRQAEIESIRKLLECAIDALELAESCEADGDFAANMEDATNFTKDATAEIKELLS